MNSTLREKSSLAFEDVFRPKPPLTPWISDYNLSLLVPIVSHWLTAAFYEILERFDLLQQYKIHTNEEEMAKNTISRLECLRGVLLVQVRPDLNSLPLNWSDLQTLGTANRSWNHHRNVVRGRDDR